MYFLFYKEIKMGKTQVIAGHTFEKISDDTYMVTFPNGQQCEKYWTAAEGLMKKLQGGNQKPKSEVYTQDDIEYKKLLAFATTLNAFQDDIVFHVDTCYKDFGSGLMWTTVMQQRKKDGLVGMFLYPAEQETLLKASYTDFSKFVSAKLSQIKKGN